MLWQKPRLAFSDYNLPVFNHAATFGRAGGRSTWMHDIQDSPRLQP